MEDHVEDKCDLNLDSDKGYIIRGVYYLLSIVEQLIVMISLILSGTKLFRYLFDGCYLKKDNLSRHETIRPTLVFVQVARMEESVNHLCIHHQI